MASATKDTGSTPATFTEFDVVVVGGGLSGLVIATRLSEDPNISVGVLETGAWRPEDPKVLIPYRAAEMFGNSEYQFISQTVPQKHLDGRELPCIRGRLMGGGSSVNFQIWHRGTKLDYDAFEALGNTGWNFDSLTKAGRKAETFHPPDTEDQYPVAAGDAGFHGTDGPVQTSYSAWVPPIKKAFWEVMEKFGQVKNQDWGEGTAPARLLSSSSAMDPQTGTRCSSAVSYYGPNASRPNLSVLCGAHAHKVEFVQDGDLQRATGVHYVSDGKKHFVKARKEVILSTGALDTPHLLELSGVGNPAILEPLGIEVKVNNPRVGENLQDHMMTWMTYLTKPGCDTLDALEIPEIAKEAEAAYAAPSKTQNHGPMGGNFDIVLNMSVVDHMSKEEVADLKRKVHEETLPLANDDGIKYQLSKLDEPERGTIQWGFIPRRIGWCPPAAESGRGYVGLMLALQHPLSRGNTHIVSADPGTQPAIDPHYLESSMDRAFLLRGLELLDEASRTEPLASMIERRVMPPGDNSRAVFDKYLMEHMMTGIHWVGTASMLPKDKGGVVDTRCKVYGTSNLRVVDASIVPLQVAAASMATLYAVAERAAELIKEDYKNAS